MFWIKFILAVVFGVWGYYGGRESEDSPRCRFTIGIRRVAVVATVISVLALFGFGGTVQAGQLDYVLIPAVAFWFFWFFGNFVRGESE